MDAATHCVICDELISSSNESDEHLVLNALGGRRRIRGFLCKQCNSDTGAEWDAPLAKQLAPFCVLLGIRRSRGRVQPVEFDMIQMSWPDFVSDFLGPVPGAISRQNILQKVRVYPGGRIEYATPTFSSKQVGDATHIHFTTRTVREMKQRMKELKRKHPELASEAADINISEAETSDYVIGWSLPEWTPNDGRVLTKSAVALAVDAGIPPRSCDRAIGFLRGDAQPCFFYWYDNDPVQNRVTGMPLHIVHVNGNSKNAQLLGYVELFGCFRFGICLSTSYSGEAIEVTYAIDPTTGDEIDVDLRLQGSPGQHCTTVGRATPSRAKYVRAVSEIMPAVIAAMEQRALARAAEQAAEYALSKIGVDSIGPEHVSELTRLAMEKMIPYLVHHLQKHRPLRPIK